jgi:hypothetical protein
MHQPPAKEKLTVSWDDVNSPDVDAKLREQESKARTDAFTSPALTMNASQLKTQQRTSIWYNTVFAMAFFGCLGGLLAWGAGELIHLKPATLADAREKWSAVQDVKRHLVAGNIDQPTALMQIEILAEAAGDNPYFTVLRKESLTPQQQQAELARVGADLATRQFIANVLKYGLIGMVIALCLSIAEPVIDRNVHGAMMNGAVGAMLGLFGGVIVSLFVDRLHAALGGTDAPGLLTAQQLIANAITYAVIGMFLLVAPGVMMRNMKKLAVGLAGGFVGGLVGGLLMAPLAKWFDVPTLSRAIVLVAIGLIAGIATGLIENAAKTGWLKVIQGFIAGKQFILYRRTTYIGAAPDCHIYLFKDPAIGRRHAAVHIVPGGFDLEDLPLGAPTYVNGKPITRTRLRTGDQIQVGQTAFTFQEKAKPA